MIKTEIRLYGEVKKPYQFCLTKTMREELDNQAKSLGVSASELVERMFRNNFMNGGNK